MNQRKGKMHAAALNDTVRVDLKDLLNVLKTAQTELYGAGEEEAAIRFEIFRDYLVNDYRGGKLAYSTRMVGL
jgi:hypothetical protein